MPQRLRLYDVMVSRMPSLGSGDVLPTLTLDYFCYRNGRHSMFFCNRIIGSFFGFFSYLKNIVFRKNCPSIFNPSTITLSPLGSAVAVVVGLCANKKMPRIAADWIITSMADTHSSRNISNLQCVGNNMSQKVSSIESHLPIIPLSGGGSHGPIPRPAIQSSSNRNSTPKSRWNRFWNLIFFQSFRIHSRQILEMTFSVNHEYAKA